MLSIFLANMTISGIKSIEKEITIDFYGKTIDSKYDPQKNRIKGIYGENGVGKSAIVTAVDIVKNIIFTNNYLSDSKNQFLLRELINKRSKKFAFQCDFVLAGDQRLIYTYELRLGFDSFDSICIEYEALKVKANSSKNRENVVFESRDGELTFLDVDNEELYEKIQKKTINRISKESALKNILVSYEEIKDQDECFEAVLEAIVCWASVSTYFDKNDRHEEYIQNIRIKELKKDNAAIEELLAELDKKVNSFGRRVTVDDYEDYEERVKKLERFVRLFKRDLKRIDIEKKENKGFYECELVMNYGDYRVNQEFESTGVKKIIDLYFALRAASNGNIVFIDEMDSNINDVYLCKIIEFFMNFGKGQLCFTSHNLDPMNVLKNNNKSIDFLTSTNRIIPWVKNGHYTPANSYRNGMIEDVPFNIDASDFISIFQED